MKICHIITRMVVGGAQENTLFSCRGQIEAGHEVVLLTGEETGKEGDLLIKCVNEQLKIIKVSNLKRNISLWDDYLAYRFLRRFFKENHFDVVHTHSSKAGLLGRLAAYQENISCVVHTIHGLPFHPYEKWYKNKLYIWAERFASRYCHKIFSVADAMTYEALRKGIGSSQMYKTIRSGMALDNYRIDMNRGLRNQLGIGDEQIVIGKVARLFEFKGHDDLIEVAEILVRDNKNLIFLVVGDGILRKILEESVNKRGLNQYFRFVGLISPDEVADYIACMDIVVHFSLREGLPRAVVQALASSRPAVSYALDGTPEVVKHYETGLIYQQNQREELVKGLVELIYNPLLRKRLGENGRQLVLKSYSWQKMVADLQQEYDDLLLMKK